MLAGLPSSDLVAGEGLATEIRRVRVSDGHVLVARLTTGEVVAFAPVCPHQFTELDEATIRDGELRCPRHGYTFDTRTGENLHPRRDTPVENLWKVRPGYLPCYQAVETDGWISVSDEPLAPPASYDPALEQRPERASERTSESESERTSESEAERASESEAVAPESDAPIVVEQSVKFLTVTSGTTVDVRLPIVPRPGFAWEFSVTGSLLEVVDSQFESGYSPCQLLQVATGGAGAATLVCTYANEKGEPASVRTFIVRVRPG
jgi:nitrite reductase/ring-hydroxylating ferredoxin subunit